MYALYVCCGERECRGASAMTYSTYKRQRIVYYLGKGHKVPTITRLLQEEGLTASQRGVSNFAKKYLETGSIARRAGSGRPSKVTAEVKAIVDAQMELDDETSAYQLHRLLLSRGYTISLRTILRCRSSLGWTFRGSAYCQLIRHVNKEKRLDLTYTCENYDIFRSY